MLERLAGRGWYYFIDIYLGYKKISIAPKDEDKTTFTYPYGTFTYKRLLFGLCNASPTFQNCMMLIFSYMVEEIIEIFMVDFCYLGTHLMTV